MKVFRREPRIEHFSSISSSSNSRSARIIGGSTSAEGEFPWLVNQKQIFKSKIADTISHLGWFYGLIVS